MSTSVLRGELKEALIQSNPLLSSIDKVSGWTCIIAMLAFEFLTFFIAITSFFKSATAMSVFTVAACVCSLVITLLTFMLWHTFCYYDPRVRKIMTTPTRFTPNGFMRVGFLPIPAAASVGLLMFLTAAFVSPSQQAGSMLQQSTGGMFMAWLPTMTCRASGIERADYLTAWDARMDRTFPSPSSTSMARIKEVFGYPSVINQEGTCFMAPYQFSQDDVIDPVTGKDRDISNLVSPQGETDGRLCMYNCVMWKTINIQTLLSASGTISVGAGIVVVFTEYFSGKLGLPTVTENTTPAQLEDLFERISPASWSRRLMKPFQASLFFCSLPITFFSTFLKQYVISKIDADGYSTVDFYVTYCLVYSVLMVTMMRLWHFFECRPQIYTQKLWHDGLDTFIVSTRTLDKWTNSFGVGQFKKIKDIGDHLVLVNVDLYQWMHLRGVERSDLLVNYCRRPGIDGTAKADKLVTLAPLKVTVTHEVELGAGMCTCEKLVVLERAGQEMEVVGWKDADLVKVKLLIAGKMEQVLVDKQECLEKADEWDKECFEMKSGDIEDAGNDTGIPSSGRSGNPVSALQQQLLTLEQKMNALEQKTKR